MNASPSTTRARDGQSPKATLVHCFGNYILDSHSGISGL